MSVEEIDAAPHVEPSAFVNELMKEHSDLLTPSEKYMRIYQDKAEVVLIYPAACGKTREIL